MRGGEGDGPSIIPHDPDNSPLWTRICSSDPDERMPPDSPGLGDDQRNILRDWIASGAHWPEDADDASLADPNSHWAFQPLRDYDGDATIDSWNRLDTVNAGPSTGSMSFAMRTRMASKSTPNAPTLGTTATT